MKAASVIAHMTMAYFKREFLIRNNVIKVVVDRLEHKLQPIKREIASALYNLLKQPKGIILWLKFDSIRVQIDSSNSYDVIVKGSPQPLPDGMGKYNNWGVFFDSTDMLVVNKEGIVLPEQYSFAFWMLYPPPPQTDNEVPSYRTLFQAGDGVGGHFAIDPSATLIGLFDDNSGDFVEFYYDLSEVQKGWQHVVLTVDTVKQQAKLSVNGQY